MDFSTPIRVVPAMTAPLTTLTTISTEITRAITPNAMMNGTHGAMAALLGLPHAQIRHGVQQRPARQAGPHLGGVGADRRRAGGVREPVQHLRLHADSPGRPAR